MCINRSITLCEILYQHLTYPVLSSACTVYPSMQSLIMSRRNRGSSFHHLAQAYRNLQLRFFFLMPLNGAPWPAGAEDCCRLLSSLATTMLIACSKISSTPLISLLLHSRYIAPILSATACPCSRVTGVSPWVFSRSMQVFLVRRSDLRPRRINGV